MDSQTMIGVPSLGPVASRSRASEGCDWVKAECGKRKDEPGRRGRTRGDAPPGGRRGQRPAPNGARNAEGGIEANRAGEEETCGQRDGGVGDPRRTGGGVGVPRRTCVNQVIDAEPDLGNEAVDPAQNEAVGPRKTKPLAHAKRSRWPRAKRSRWPHAKRSRWPRARRSR
jgi:hypothetical protein